MKKVKITVMNIGWLPELAEGYAAPDLAPCEYHRKGQVFYSNGWQKPEGLCDNAWKSMLEYVMTLAHGGEDFYNGWMKDKKTAMIACNDGFRPVSFLLEATEEEAPTFIDADLNH